ncbi:MAG: hypothetical protein ACJ71Q_14365 [Terriglobales bacterium]
MKRWWFGPKKHIDEQKVEARRNHIRRMQRLFDSGDEAAFREYVKHINPDISEDELDALTTQFHGERRRHPSDDYL